MEGDRLDGQPDWLRWLNRLLWVLALAGLIYLVGLTIWLGVAAMLFPYQLDYGEGLLLHFVREWARGRPIYTEIECYPYITSNYPPLSMLLALALKPVLGITYAAGRLWTLVAIVAIVAMIVAWVHRTGFSLRCSSPKGGRWLPPIAAGMAFAGSPYVYHWAPLFRVDLIGLALTLGGLYAVWRAAPSYVPRESFSSPHPGVAERRRTCVFLGLAVVLFVAGLYAKQSFVFAPLAAVVYLFLFADRGQAIGLAVAVGILGGGVFLLVNALTGGAFWESLVVSNVNPFLWPEFWQQIGAFFRTFAILAVLAAWYALDKYVLESSRLDDAAPLRTKVNPLDLYVLVALASVGLAGKAGAWENYFFEALLALTLCAGLGLARMICHPTLLVRVLAPLLVLAQVGLMWHSPAVAADYLRVTRHSNQEMAPILASTPDSIVSEDMGLLVSNDKVLDYYGFQYSQLSRAGRWDQAWELDQLRNGRFSLVILEKGTRLDVDQYQRFTREFLSELDRNYGLSCVVGKYELYKRDPLQHERQVDFGKELRLVGWSLNAPPEIAPGDTLSVTVVWQAQQALGRDYTAFAHLVDEGGRGWAGDDHQPYDGLYPTSAWGAAEMVRDTFSLSVPTGAPSGLYAIEVGWYDPVTQERLHVDGGGEYRVLMLPVAWRATGPKDLVPFRTRFGELITLEGAAWQEDRDAIQVSLRWVADSYLDVDFTVFVHLVAQGERGPVLAQGDAPPLGGRWPTSLWLPGVALDDSHTVQVPPDLAPGVYDLLVGLYDPRTARRLTLPDGNEAVRIAEVDLR